MVNENVEVARGYHARTKHSEERLRASPHHLDWENQPVPFKLYRDLETIPLPRQLEPGTVSALHAISASVVREAEPTEQVPGLGALARVGQKPRERAACGLSCWTLWVVQAQ